MHEIVDNDFEEDKEDIVINLLSDYMMFLRFFFKLMNGREFQSSCPIGRKSHFTAIGNELVDAALNSCCRKIINVPPGYSKSTMLIYWVAWTMARWPDSKYLYISYSKTLSSKHTETIRRIMQLPEYKELFGFTIRHDARGKEMFQTTKGGVVAAVGIGGSITGLDAGMPGLDRFSGALIIDDAHKPDEVHSDKIRSSVITNYKETLAQRVRGINVPIIMIAQRLHEDDLPAFLLNGGDGYEWERIVLKALDVNDNALWPEKDPKKSLMIKRDTDIYTFASQFQQDPQPAGGALYKRKMFPILDEEPKFITTFVTCDTAETSKSYNDATVFSFWGLYKIESMGHETSEYGLHWIDMHEVRVEPKELKDEFMGFWGRCQCHINPPRMAAIEKKSTGVTLISILDELRGMEIRNIDRNVSSSSKSQRFLWLQPYVASRLVSFTAGAKHSALCIKQAEKITANDTHAFDDIIDTLYDAVKIAIIDKTLILQNTPKVNESLRGISKQFAVNRAAKHKAYGYDALTR